MRIEAGEGGHRHRTPGWRPRNLSSGISTFLWIGLGSVSLIGCTCREKPPHSTSQARSPSPAGKEGRIQDSVAQARGEFELLPEEYGAGTSKLYSRRLLAPR